MKFPKLENHYKCTGFIFFSHLNFKFASHGLRWMFYWKFTSLFTLEALKTLWNFAFGCFISFSRFQVVFFQNTKYQISSYIYFQIFQNLRIQFKCMTLNIQNQIIFWIIKPDIQISNTFTKCESYKNRF